MNDTAMDAKTAKEIATSAENYTYGNSQVCRSKGYLEGMKDPAVLALVEALELWDNVSQIDRYQNERDMRIWELRRKRTLAKYREAVKP